MTPSVLGASSMKGGERATIQLSQGHLRVAIKINVQFTIIFGFYSCCNSDHKLGGLKQQTLVFHNLVAKSLKSMSWD